MRFYLSTVILLLTIAVGMFFGGINIGVIFHISEWVLVLGIAIASFMISNPTAFFVELFKQLPYIFSEKPHFKNDYLELLAFMFNFFRRVNTMTAAEIEAQIDAPHNSVLFNGYPYLLSNKNALSFFQNHFRVTTLGFQDIYEVENRMDDEIDKRKHYLLKVPKALNKLADALPALGIVAAVLGVIGAMSAVGGSAEILGARVATALIGTFIGVFFSYCIVNPLSTFLEKYHEDDMDFIICMKVGMISYMKGYQIQICIEFARQMIPDDLQPSFIEVENLLYNTTNKE